MRPWGVIAAALAFGGAVNAAEIKTCDGWIANARNVDWNDPTRSFANGAIRLIALDTDGEPACCSFHLMVLFPDGDEPSLSCTLISQRGDLGWASLALSQARSSYDPARGLTVHVPMASYADTGDDIAAVPQELHVTIHQGRGTVTAQSDMQP